MDQVQNKVQNAVTDMMKSLEKDHVRKMQAKMYHCSAACCENKHYQPEDVQRCLENCARPVTQAKALMDNELGHYQERLQRCAMDCQDQVRDKVGPQTSEADMAKFRSSLEGCVVKCADTHIALIPAMMKRMQQVLQQQI